MLRLVRDERGQGLALGALALFVILGFAALVLDVGLFMHEKRDVQNAVDAAALAAAQEMPDDIYAAEDVAREWLEKNGVATGDDITIDFRCTSEYLIACDPSQDRYDTIQVSVDRNVPLNFAPLLGLDQVDVSAKGAACTGLCGRSPFRALDVMMVLDRTGSMSNGDMRRAKDGAKSILGVFDEEWQRVGLAALGPARGTSDCQAERYSWSSVPPWPNEPDARWVTTHLSDDYQNPDGSPDESSSLVANIACLHTSSVGTDLGDPFWAAVEELQANGREGEHWGIIFMSDGAANQAEDARNQYCESEGDEPDDYNPCEYAYEKAEEAKAMGIEVYTIGYGVDDDDEFSNQCVCDDGPWKDKTARELLQAMATEDPEIQHYFEEPRGGDLEPVFQTIGWQLLSGIQLVQVEE